MICGLKTLQPERYEGQLVITCKEDTEKEDLALKMLCYCLLKKKRREKEDPVLTTCYVIILMYECACVHSFVFVMLQFKFNNKKREERE